MREPVTLACGLACAAMALALADPAAAAQPMPAGAPPYGQAMPPPYAYPAIPPEAMRETIAMREGWLARCRARLIAANQGAGDLRVFDAACHDWLAWYEAAGYARAGYGFSDAIPVAVTVIPGYCVPCPAPEHRPLPRARRPLRDKRIRL